jgi:hypothetical protein
MNNAPPLTGCQTCRHWHRTAVGQGDCRAHPPTVAFLMNGPNIARLTGYPERKANDPTCGEHKPVMILAG